MATRHIDVSSEAEMLEHIHNETLSDEPIVAATARLLKEVLPVVFRAWEAEIDMGTDKLTVLRTNVGMCLTILFSFAATYSGSDAVTTGILEAIKRDFSREYDKRLRELKERCDG